MLYVPNQFRIGFLFASGTAYRKVPCYSIGIQRQSHSPAAGSLWSTVGSTVGSTDFEMAVRETVHYSVMRINRTEMGCSVSPCKKQASSLLQVDWILLSRFVLVAARPCSCRIACRYTSSPMHWPFILVRCAPLSLKCTVALYPTPSSGWWMVCLLRTRLAGNGDWHCDESRESDRTTTSSISVSVLGSRTKGRD
jgi:hypothetical protein